MAETMRVLAAFLGTLPVAVLFVAALCRLLPVSEQLRFALGFGVSLPTWVGLICVFFLARSAWRSWALCGLLSAGLALLVYGI